MASTRALPAPTIDGVIDGVLDTSRLDDAGAIARFTVPDPQLRPRAMLSAIGTPGHIFQADFTATLADVAVAITLSTVRQALNDGNPLKVQYLLVPGGDSEILEIKLK